MKKIVLAYDGSDAAIQAAYVAADVALRYGAKVIAIKVGRLMEPVDGLLLPTMDEEFHYSIAETGAGLVRQLEAPAEARIEWDDPAKAIVELAEQERACLIVIGHRPPRGIRRLFYRSVASKVTDRAPCPVLVVRNTTGPFDAVEVGEYERHGEDTVS